MSQAFIAAIRQVADTPPLAISELMASFSQLASRHLRAMMADSRRDFCYLMPMAADYFIDVRPPLHCITTLNTDIISAFWFALFS